MKIAYRMTLTSLLRLALFLGVFWSIAPARAAQTWNEVTAPPVYTTNCVTGQTETLSLASIAWYGDPNSPPQVNTVYYARISWGVTGDPCSGGAQVAPELFLPDGTSLAISAANPVKCFAVNLTTLATSQETSQCPQAPSTGVQGGLGFYPVGGSNVTWPSAQGYGWQILVPLLSTMPLSGTVTSTDPTKPCPSCLTAAVWSIDGVQDPWAFPRVGVRISGPAGMPSITYPSPSISSVTTTSAKGTAYLSSQNTTGNIFFQYSTNPPAGSTCTASTQNVPVTQMTASPLSFYINFTNVQPGTTLYWRMCYTTGGLTYIGATQSFQTTDLPPQITAISPAMALPGRSVTISGAHLVGTTSVSFHGSQNVVTASITNKTASSVTFTVPNIPFQTGTVSVTTPEGTTTSTSTFSVGIDTILDNYQGSTTNSNGTVNLTIHFHSTEPSPSAQFDCELDNGPLAQTCDAGVVTFNGLIGQHQVTITAHASGFRDPTPLVLHFLFAPVHILSPIPVRSVATDPTGALTSDTGKSTFISNDEECTTTANTHWMACASADSLNALPEAMKKLVVAAWDADGNGAASAASPRIDEFQFKTVLLTSFPGLDVTATTSRTASFSFQSERGVGFQCSVDYAAWVPCEGPVVLRDLAVGPHAFLVRAVDDRGNVDFLPAAKSWTVE